MDKENTQNLGQTSEGQIKMPLETRTGSSNTAEKTSKVIQSKRRHVSFKQDTSKSLNNGKSVDKLLLIPKQIISSHKISNTRKPPLSATLVKRSTDIDGGLMKLNTTANGKMRSKQDSKSQRESEDGSARNSIKLLQEESPKAEVINPFQPIVEEASAKTANPMEFTLAKFAPGGEPVDQSLESPKFQKASSAISSSELRKSQESKIFQTFAGGIKSPKARFLVNTALQAKKIKSEDPENTQSPHEVHKLVQENNQLKKENDRKEELIGFLLSALKQKEVTIPTVETPTVTLPEIECYTSPKESNRYFNFNLHDKPLSAGMGKSNLLVPPKGILNGPKIEAFERNKSQQFSGAFVQPPDFPAFRPTKPVFSHHRRMRSPVLPVFQKAKSIYNFNEMLTIQRGNSSPAYSPNYPVDTNAPLLTMPEDGDMNFRDVFLTREISTKNLRNNNINNPALMSIQHNLANSRRNLSNLQKFDIFKDSPRTVEQNMTHIRKSLNDQDRGSFNPTNGADLNATFNPQKCQPSENAEAKTVQPEFVDSFKKPRATLVRKNLKDSSSKPKMVVNPDCNKENAIKIFESYQSSTTKDDSRKEKFPKDIFNINIKKKFFG